MHLYIHVPFCARRCTYCDFAISVRREVPSARFVEAILAEWHQYRAVPPVAGWTELKTLYLGGGTPSRLDPIALDSLLGAITSDLPLADEAEVTIEVNPDDVSMPAAMAWRMSGINRVSLGVQSHDPRVLEWMHRTHTADQVQGAVAMLREAGFDNLSLDLIFALPYELRRDWDRDLELSFDLRPDHISLYGLTVEPATPLARWHARGETILSTDTRYAEEYLLAHERLLLAGYTHYEVSNAGVVGRRAHHNSAYWTGVDYLGLGPSAHSLLQGIRSWHIRDWAAWERAIREGRPTREGDETLTPESRALEQLYLGLRTDRGLPARQLPPGQVATWLREGWAMRAEDRIRLTPEGWLRLDALVAGVGGS